MTVSKRLIYVAAGLVGLAALLAGIGAWIVFGPNTPAYEGERTVTIPQRDFDAAVDSLDAAGLLASESTFRLVANATGWDQQIKPGHYAFASGVSSYDILDTIRKGLQTPVRVTIPPGRGPRIVAAVMGRNLKFSKDDFLSTLHDSTLARELDVDPGHLFGYMLPATYEFYWQTPADEIVRRVKQHFDAFYQRELADAAADVGLTKLEVLTLASIVEWEAYVEEEKKTIAGVYMNRLEDQWPLQADPTIQYVLIDTKGSRTSRVLYEHLEIEHPYNTYINGGLPPGPITNPARSTLRAAASPESHNYYFFAADGSGGHRFSRTLREHNQAAREYHRKLDEWEREREEQEE
ncbi:hypothetical protein CRI94_11065 [Longibacter salinarum]|uniref:Endolytic murein transglycosylase n=1 Tax=Longibacter salinarum TaxID=1850348 RepID=A0A2A8CXS8_9BACT|nr:endolytic transglycosylase MltG [Longibacter salinarum]PEN13178.1 hypothetical protein CRI94_11065 [Longibacter salinarum]